MELKRLDADAPAKAESAEGKSSSKTIPTSTAKLLTTLIPIALVGIGLGVLSGFGLHSFLPGNQTSNLAKITEIGGAKAGEKYGMDKQESQDEVTGYLEKGGLDGGGTHSLLRPGGVSQNVYLTSSVVDLDELVGAEVKVWGDTFAAQKAGWLLDVVGLEVVKLQGVKPE